MIDTRTLVRPDYQTQQALDRIPAAGVKSRINDTAKDALTWQQPPATPDGQRKYQHFTLTEPGKPFKHFGTADDAVPEGPHGRKNACGAREGAGELFKQMPESDIGRWKLERAEDVYASSRREPLGQGTKRGYNIPPELGTTRPFGIAYHSREQDMLNKTKDTIFPAQAAEDDQQDAQMRALYITSHGSYGPAEQRTRHYDWDRAGINPATHSFGAKVKKPVHDGVKMLLNPSLDVQATQAQRKVVSKHYEDFKMTASDTLGKPKLLGVGGGPLPPNCAFGKTSGKEPEPGVDALIRGFYSVEQQQPDADLGKSIREGWRNTAPEDKVFGVPSIRTDVPMPATRSVATAKNYGNEPDASQLLRPSKASHLGVNEEHFLRMRGVAEMRSLVDDAGLPLDDAEFGETFNMAANLDQQHPEYCCLDTFMKARQSLLARASGLPAPPC